MSGLTTPYAVKLAQNLLLVDSTAVPTTIAAPTGLFVGLQIGAAFTSNVDADWDTEIVEPSDGGTIASQEVLSTGIFLDTCTDNGYHRIPLDTCTVVDGLTTDEAFEAATIAGYTGGALSNGNPIKFATAVGANWGDVYGWFITDTDDLTTHGNVTLTGTITNPPVTINVGDRAIFNSGSFSITIE